jgi:hypothetical protein
MMYVCWGLCHKPAGSVTANAAAVTRSKRNCEDMQKKTFGRRVIRRRRAYNKVQEDQKVSVHLMIIVQKHAKNILKYFNHLPL